MPARSSCATPRLPNWAPNFAADCAYTDCDSPMRCAAFAFFVIASVLSPNTADNAPIACSRSDASEMVRLKNAPTAAPTATPARAPLNAVAALLARSDAFSIAEMFDAADFNAGPVLSCPMTRKNKSTLVATPAPHHL